MSLRPGPGDRPLRRLLLPLLLCAVHATAPAQTPVGAQQFTSNRCDPCEFEISPDLPVFEVRPVLRPLADGRKVLESLQVARIDDPGSPQTLPVHGATPIRQGESYVLAVEDINFDGFNDLLVVTEPEDGGPGRAEYWLFDPEREVFSHLGTYPRFQVDAKRRRLVTLELLDGDADTPAFIRRQYQFIDGVLTVNFSDEPAAPPTAAQH